MDDLMLRSMLRRPVSIAFLVVLAAGRTSGGQAAARPDSAALARTNRSGTWTAATSSGVPLVGTWTAVVDTTHGTVIGTWTLIDAQRKPVANGRWSAVKSADKWTGAWRANVADHPGEYTGTWSAAVDLRPGASFGELFEKAALAAVNGAWRGGGREGGWSIRVAK
jgi:hypothetical protein